ncbi:putative HLH transcription factor [Taphrina deformans PYCC 5710]|uniref:HLH transcription factor n=1 Tax=Taphrina deformans (strain PYCC 5710 / ATCC 11124 / CBS 356.35 / IMI 108563 / JCM 9778 / NBRC 8474) TaxID=1097556 RepID=R4X8D6_TAPDE|nr:putative HLH transcription factor [Taphrina deformans PYCC 5710]|eukprot:CCG81833.1 putative HLH transcription factor [Taphrina deformans PYCC 5710]
MEFDESLFSASIDATLLQGQIDTSTLDQRAKHNRIDTQKPADQAAIPQQNFYPTPNSTNMHAGTSNMQFMSPFIANYQSYSNTNSEIAIAELDELLFTPMMSPAMTPMQQYNNMQPAVQVDWDQFDQNFFALTDSAIGESRIHAPPANTRDTDQSTTTVGQPAKKQRIGTGSSKTSRQTSPTTSYSTGSKPSSLYHHKRNNSMVAIIQKQRSDKESSFESSDGVSPVDLEHFVSHDRGSDTTDNFTGTGHIQPITPSMLMSLQKGGHGTDGSEETPLDPSFLPQTGVPTDLQLMPSPALINHSNNSRPNSTNRSQSAIARDVRPRPIAPARPQSLSISSSPALGPQSAKPSPDIRPILPGGMSPQVGAMLASKSNYQHIVDGTYDQLNITYPQGMTQGLEVRRTSHKAAEQKRRDHLKECFELLRMILPDRPEPGASKVAILKKGYEHILSLHDAMKTKDAEIARLKGLAGEEEEEEEEDK